MKLDQAILLKAWQRYIEITGCEKSKIPVKKINHCQNILFKASDLIENPKSNGIFIELNPTKIAQLKEKYVIYDEETETEKLQDSLVFAFPLLTIHEKNSSFHLPLFIVDLPENFLIVEPMTGFDIAAHNPDCVKINISVFMNYLDIDPDQVDETRNLIELVSLICETPFTDFKSMYAGFIQWANNKLETKHNNFKQIYFATHTDGLIYSQHSEAFSPNKDLEDFQYLLSEIETHGNAIIAQKYTLLDSYLSKIGKTQSIVNQYPVPLVKSYGLFESKYALGRGQYQAIQAANLFPALPLIAVQGAPGTGKTTLFKSLIAQQITARALAIIEGKDQNLNMLVCSTAIKAVDNVIADFKADAFTQDLNWLWFHGGAKNKVEIEIQTRLEPHILSLIEHDFNQDEYQHLKHQILSTQAQIDTLIERYNSELTAKCQAMQKIPFLKPDDDYSTTALVTHLNQYLSDHDQKLDPRFKAKTYSEEQLQANHLQLTQELSLLKTKIKQIDEALAHVKNLIAYWPRKFTPSQFSDWMLNKKVRGSFGLSFADFFKLQFLKFIRIFSPAKINLLDACEVLSHHDQLDQMQASLAYLNEQYDIIHHFSTTTHDLKTFDQLHQAFIKEYAGCKNLSDVLRLKAITENRNIFELSTQFLYQEQLRRKNDLIEVLNHWSSMLKGSKKSAPVFEKYKKESENFYNLLSLAYPVVATTLASAYKMSGYNKLQQLNTTKPWNLALLDEAGMVSVENLLPIISRSTKAMIVGDPLQLEPIRTLSQPSIQKVYNEYFKAHDGEYARVGPGQVTTYHRAAGTLAGDVSDIGDGIILDEHRRCQAPIAQLFIDIAQYNGLTVSTFQPTERIQNAFDQIGGHHLMFYHVDGMSASGKTNLDEVRGIGELLNQLEQAGYDLTADVGIITPYADQKRLLINAYGKRLDQDKMAKIGTIHQFQGVGFEVIIFSPVIFRPDDRAAFLNNHPNMLNVAVSRAKQQFIVIANYHKLKESKGSLGLIAERASTDFYLELGSQSPSYEDYSESFSVEKQIYDEQHIKAFAYYLKNARQSIVIVVPWIRKAHPSNIPQKQLELIKTAKRRGINIKVYYGYNNQELNQKDDNDADLVQEYMQTIGSENVVRLPQGTHEKVLLIDDRILVIGSWNWLSNAYYKWYEHPIDTKVNLAIRRETSIILMDRKLISEYKMRNMINEDPV